MGSRSTKHYSIAELVEEFPELKLAEINLSKEVFAHFGLLYMGFALLEHSMINAATIQLAIDEAKLQKIRRLEQWEAIFDVSFGKAIKLTFGNLARTVRGISEFKDLSDDLGEVKKIRDYFSHHFLSEKRR